MKHFFKKAFIALGLIIAPLAGCKPTTSRSRYVKYGNDEIGWKTEKLYVTGNGKNVKADNIRLEEGYEFFVHMSSSDERFFEDVSPVSPAFKEGMIRDNEENENTYVNVTDKYAFIVSIEKIEHSVFVSYGGKNSIVVPSRTPSEDEKECIENLDETKVVVTGSIKFVTPKKNGQEWFELNITIRETNCGRDITDIVIIDVNIPRDPPPVPPETHTIFIYIEIHIVIIDIFVIPEDDPETSSQSTSSQTSSQSGKDGYIWEAMDYGYDVWCNQMDYTVGDEFSIDNLVVYRSYYVHNKDYSDYYYVNVEVPHDKVKYQWCEYVLPDDQLVGSYVFHDGPTVFHKATTEPFKFLVYDDVAKSWLDITPNSTYYFWATWHEAGAIEDPNELYGFVMSTAVMKKTYKVGEKLDLSGLKVFACYRSGYRPQLSSSQYTIDTGEVNMKEPGSYGVTVSYAGYSDGFIISVTK